MKHRPGDRPIPDVAAQETGPGPPLCVLYHHFFAQADFPGGLTQPVAELDVLDTRPSVRLVKPIQLNKDIAPDGAAAAPEGRGVQRGCLMNEMVRQILIA